MRVRLRHGYRSIRVKARRYNSEQRQFLRKYIDPLKDMEFVKEFPAAEWQAAPLLVTKLGSRAGYSMTVDLRPVSAATIKESWPMPHLDSEVFGFTGSSCFASLHFVSGYWQLSLHQDSYTACGVVTPRAVVISKRVLQGLANAVAYFQSTIELLFSELRSFFKAWFDDFSLHANSEEILLDKLEIFPHLSTEAFVAFRSEVQTFPQGVALVRTCYFRQGLQDGSVETFWFARHGYAKICGRACGVHLLLPLDVHRHPELCSKNSTHK